MRKHQFQATIRGSSSAKHLIIGWSSSSATHNNYDIQVNCRQLLELKVPGGPGFGARVHTYPRIL